MTLATLLAYTGYAHELSQLNNYGETLPRDKQTHLCALVSLTCRTEDRTINTQLQLRGEVPFQLLEEIPGKSRLNVVAYATAVQGISDLCRRKSWTLYCLERISIPEDAPFFEFAGKNGIDVTKELSEPLAELLREATSRQRETESAFEKARAFLNEHADYLRHNASSARSAANFVTSCMRSSAELVNTAWNAEKSTRILREVNDLIGRTNTGHPNYLAALDSLKGNLYSIRCPTQWGDTPPHPSCLSL